MQLFTVMFLALTYLHLSWTMCVSVPEIILMHFIAL